MSKTTELELRLAVIERRQRLLFDALKNGNITALVHHWKQAPAWCEKRANEALPPARPKPEPGPRIPVADPNDPAAYIEPEEPATPWRDEEGKVVTIEAHPVTGSPIRSAE